MIDNRALNNWIYQNQQVHISARKCIVHLSAFVGFDISIWL